MTEVKIFTQETCPNCPPTKELGRKLAEKGVKVEFFDIRTSEGLAESVFYSVLSTPSTIIVKEGKKVKSYLGITPKIEDVLQILD